MGPLGRNIPRNFDHVEKYPLTLDLIQKLENVPVPLGINWYSGFDFPNQDSDGRYILPEKRLGSIRGGHNICAVHKDAVLNAGEWVFYNQRNEGACVGFAHARAMSLLTGNKEFDAFWLYDDARRAEGAYPDQEGSTNDGGCKALKLWGAHYEEGKRTCTRTPWDEWEHKKAKALYGYHWAVDWEGVLAALGYQEGPVPLVNSWGKVYPEIVWLPDKTGERLMRESGEASVFTSI
jgi:hypothetical protein